mgnify:CR=1 FL=1
MLPHSKLIQKSQTNSRSIKISQTDLEEHLRKLTNEVITCHSLLKGIMEAIESRDIESLSKFTQLTTKHLESL